MVWWSLCLVTCGPGPAGSDTTGVSSGPDPVTGELSSGGLPTSGGGGTSTTAGLTTVIPTTESDETTFDPNGCGPLEHRFPFDPPALILVLDKSGRVGDGPGHAWDHDADDLDDDGLHDADPRQPATPRARKWASVHAAVDEIVHRFELTMLTGVSLFPRVGTLDGETAAACAVAGAVELVPGPQLADAVVAALPPPDGLVAGAQPIAAAFVRAVAALDAFADRPRHIVVVTASAANCHAGAADPDARFETLDPDLLAAVAAAAAGGVVTHVVGLDLAKGATPGLPDGQPDGVDLVTVLTALASAGGAPPHNVHTEVELGAALDEIARSTVSCRFVFDPGAAYRDYVEIEVGGVDVGRPWETDCAGQDGWHYLDPDGDGPDAFELCGSVCADYQTSGELRYQFSCPNT